MYAVVETQGKQYTVTEGQRFQVDRMPVDAGSTVELDRVLLVADGDKVTVGDPLVKDAKVIVQAVEEKKGKKVLVFRYKRKTRYRRKTGHRQLLTTLIVKDIVAEKKRKAKKKVDADGS